MPVHVGTALRQAVEGRTDVIMTNRRILEIVVVIVGLVILFGSLVYLAAGLTLTG